MSMNRSPHIRRAWHAMLILMALVLVQPAQATLIKIGVFSPDGFESGMQHWQPSADYLSDRFPQWQFQVLPYRDLAELEQDARRGKFDFVLTQPASFVRLEQQAGLIRLLTRVQQDGDQRHTHTAAVIFTRADNPELHRLADFARTPFVTTSPQDYSGWQLVQLELLRHQRDPDRAFTPTFAGNAEGVLDGVMRGDYPAGAMAARDFDRFLRQGRISPGAVRILEAQDAPGFPFRFSGRLYPQWPLGAMPDTPAKLRSAVTRALQSLPEGHAALRAGEYAGWQQADNYHAVRPLLEKSLTRHVVERQINVANLWLQQNQPTLLISLIFTLLVWLLLRLSGRPRNALPQR